jgi:hypothetical protein
MSLPDQNLNKTPATAVILRGVVGRKNSESSQIYFTEDALASLTQNLLP